MGGIGKLHFVTFELSDLKLDQTSFLEYSNLQRRKILEKERMYIENVASVMNAGIQH